MEAALLLLMMAFDAFACVTGGVPLSASHAALPPTPKHLRSKARKPANLFAVKLPSYHDHPWGGSDPSKWTEEAAFANAVSQALNEGWAEGGDVADVRVSVPVRMQPGQVPVGDGNYGNRPYGDGQTNAHVTFGSNLLPPLVATLTISKSGERRFRLRFQGPLAGDAAHGVQLVSGGKTYSIPAGASVKDAWPVPAEIQWGDLFSNHVAFLKIVGDSQLGDAWFPIDFRDVVLANSDLLSQVDPSKRNLGKGTLLDPEQVRLSPILPYDQIHSPTFARDLNSEYYSPIPGIHSSYYDPSGQLHTTAVGGGTTVVLPSPSMSPSGPAPFKMAYLCFDARNPGVENSHHTPGEAAKFAPSGAGWHEIGDPAETVINSLEDAPVVFGYANGQPAAHPPSGTFAFGLTDVAVVRLLQPGSALVTAAGFQTLQEGYGPTRGHGPSAGRNFHWFAFDQAEPVCAVEWVHPCVPNPTNHVGTSCP